MGSARALPGRRENLTSAARAMAAATRVKDGCHSYGFFSDIDDENTIVSLEIWRDQDALDAHMASTAGRGYTQPHHPPGIRLRLTPRRPRPTPSALANPAARRKGWNAEPWRVPAERLGFTGFEVGPPAPSRTGGQWIHREGAGLQRRGERSRPVSPLLVRVDGEHHPRHRNRKSGAATPAAENRHVSPYVECGQSKSRSPSQPREAGAIRRCSRRAAAWSAERHAPSVRISIAWVRTKNRRCRASA